MISNTDSTPLIYSPEHMLVKVYNGLRGPSNGFSQSRAPVRMAARKREQRREPVSAQALARVGAESSRRCLIQGLWLLRSVDVPSSWAAGPRPEGVDGCGDGGTSEELILNRSTEREGRPRPLS